MENIIWYSLKHAKIFDSPYKEDVSRYNQKICKITKGNENLGLTIRGGKESNIGIFVSNIDKGSLAENSGLKIGDQVLSVNGYSFLDILHSKAVGILKENNDLIIISKELELIPLYVEIWKIRPFFNLNSSPGQNIFSDSHLIGISNPAFIPDDHSIDCVHIVKADNTYDFESVSLKSSLSDATLSLNPDSLNLPSVYLLDTKANKIIPSASPKYFADNFDISRPQNSSSPLYSVVNHHHIKNTSETGHKKNVIGPLKRSKAFEELDKINNEPICNSDDESMNPYPELTYRNNNKLQFNNIQSYHTPKLKKYNSVKIKTLSREEIISRSVFKNLSVNDKYRHLYNNSSGNNLLLPRTSNGYIIEKIDIDVDRLPPNISTPLRIKVLKDYIKFVSMSNLGETDELNRETDLLESKRTISMDDNFYEQDGTTTSKSLSSSSKKLPTNQNNYPTNDKKTFFEKPGSNNENGVIRVEESILGGSSQEPTQQFVSNETLGQPLHNNRNYIVKTMAQLYQQKIHFTQLGEPGRENDVNYLKNAITTTTNLVSKMVAKFESEKLMLLPAVEANSSPAARFVPTPKCASSILPSEIKAIVNNTNMISSMVAHNPEGHDNWLEHRPKTSNQSLINLKLYGPDEHARSLAELKNKLAQLSRNRESSETDYIEENIYENIEIIKEYFPTTTTTTSYSPTTTTTTNSNGMIDRGSNLNSKVGRKGRYDCEYHESNRRMSSTEESPERTEPLLIAHI